jgi:hypothetical protein
LIPPQNADELDGIAAASVIVAGPRGNILCRGESAAEMAAVPLTTFAGYESDLTLSPDGNSMAVSWNGEEQAISIFT